MQAVWSGTISFGLIHIPIKLFSAANDGKMSFRFLRRQDLCPISYVKVCRADGEDVPKEDIVRGYEYQKGGFVILDDDDFRRAGRNRSRTIEVDRFVGMGELSGEIFAKPYYIEPGEGAEKAYVLLKEALWRSQKAGIAKFVLRDREHLAALIAKENVLLLELLRFKHEIRDPEKLNIPQEAGFRKKELEIAQQLIDHMTEPFKYEEFQDTYTTELQKIVRNKAKGKIYRPKEEPAITADVTDIMEKLKKSLEEAKKKRS